MEIYKKIVNHIIDVFELIAVVCLACMVFAVLIQVVGRYGFSYTPSWSEEMARQFMIIFSFIGIVIGVRDKIHIAVTIVVDNLDRTARLYIEIFGKFLIIILGVMISINMGLLFSNLKYNRLPGTGIPILFIYMFPTIVGILTALVAVYQVSDHFKSGTDEEQRQHKVTAGEGTEK